MTEKALYNIRTDMLTIGDHINVRSGGNISFAKDQARAEVHERNFYQKAERTIRHSEAGKTDREDALDSLEKIGKELKKPRPDEKRLNRLWNSIADAIPEAEQKIFWDAVVNPSSAEQNHSAYQSSR